MGREGRYPAEVRERAVRLVFEQQEAHESQWAAIESIVAKIGCTVDTLRQRIRQAERDSGARPGLAGQERRAGLPVQGRFHILRHTSCSLLGMRGAPPMPCRPLLGKRRSTMTAPVHGPESGGEGRSHQAAQQPPGVRRR